MKFSFFVFLWVATCLESFFADELELVHIASVMVKPSILHRCNAFFVTAGGDGEVTEGKHLVTTASCVIRSEYNYTVSVGDALIGQDQYYDVETVHIHPNYSKNPEMYNIAVITLEKPATGVHVYQLLHHTDYYDAVGTLYLWRFVDEVYKLTENVVSHVPEEFYERATHLQLGGSEIAVMSNTSISTGFYDVGTPYVVRGSNMTGDSADKTYYVMGFLAKIKLEAESKFFALYSIPYFTSWISPHLSLLLS